MIDELRECRVCKNGDIREVVSLGNLYLSGFIGKDELSSEGSRVPLVLVRCENCGLVQLKYTAEMDSMYRQYWYKSALNKSMVSSLKNVVENVENVVRIDDGDTVVDIGCNDGTLLQLYSNKNITRVGYDPARNIERSGDFHFVNEYFTADGYFDVYGHLKAKAVTAIAMFYDLPDPIKFTKDVRSILRDDGIFIVQFTDLKSMFSLTAFDNICHEHLEYYRLRDVINILREAGLQAIDVSNNDVNGGSLRVVAAPVGAYPVSDAVEQALKEEDEYFSAVTFADFRESIAKAVYQVRGFLEESKQQGKTVVVLGASTKGNMLLQVCKITDEDIPYAAEVSKDKWGLKTAGSNIQIIPEDMALATKPDYFLVLPWHFKASLLTKEGIRSFLNDGGKLVFPLPEFEIIGKEDVVND